jgi:hypothetical protein
MQIVVNCETRLCSQLLGPGDNFLQSYGTIFTDRAATGSGSLMDPMSTPVFTVSWFLFLVFIFLGSSCGFG